MSGKGNVARAFGARVRYLRQCRTWTQEDLAVALGAAGHPMHHSTVAKLEVGTRPTTIDEAVAIARILGVEVRELLAVGGAA